MSGEVQDSGRPLLSVVKGTPTEEELAALLAVVAAKQAVTTSAPSEVASVWAAKSRLVRPPLRPGPNAWRASAWPR